MQTPDVNILVAAFRRDAEHHAQHRRWLTAALRSSEGLALSPLALSGFMRVMTTPVVARDTVSRAEIHRFVDVLVNSRRATLLIPGPDSWRIFRRLCQSQDINGKLVADAYHAAIAIEHDCEWITLDRDFARFPGLRWSTPF